ncbi:MAG: hypothetical protein ABI401_05030 [Candidatus Dormibacter sp.]
MNGVVLLGLGQGKLVMLSFELVAAVGQPVRPGDQYLSARSRSHLVWAVPVEYRPAVTGQLAKATPHGHDGQSKPARGQLDLFA